MALSLPFPSLMLKFPINEFTARRSALPWSSCKNNSNCQVISIWLVLYLTFKNNPFLLTWTQASVQVRIKLSWPPENAWRLKGNVAWIPTYFWRYFVPKSICLYTNVLLFENASRPQNQNIERCSIFSWRCNAIQWNSGRVGDASWRSDFTVGWRGLAKSPSSF